MRGWLTVCERLLQHRQRVREQQVKQAVEEIKSIADAVFPAECLPAVLETIQRENDKRWLEQKTAPEDEGNPCTGLPYVNRPMWFVFDDGGLLTIYRNEFVLVEHPDIWRLAKGATHHRYQEGHDERDAVRELLRRSMDRCRTADAVAMRAHHDHNERVEHYRWPSSLAKRPLHRPSSLPPGVSADGGHHRGAVSADPKGPPTGADALVEENQQMKGWMTMGRQLITTPLFSVSIVTRNMRPSLRVQVPLSPPRKRAKNKTRK